MRKSLLIGACVMTLVGCQSEPKSTTAGTAMTTAVMPTTAPAVAASVPATQPKMVARFGEAQRLTDADAVPVEKVLASPGDYKGKYVRVTGIVSAVCPTKGCWLRVAPEPGSGHGDIFVKFVDPPEGRLIPMEAVGHDVTVEGIIRNGAMSEAQARHLKMDAGASQEEIDKIVGPQKQVMIGKPAVTIEGVTAPG